MKLALVAAARASLAPLAAVGVEMATLVLQAAAAPAPFNPPKLVGGSGHDRRGNGAFGKQWSKPLPPFDFGLLSPHCRRVGIALLEVQVRQPI
jgi:hypothetical protein